MEKMTNKKALEFVLGLDQVKENVEIMEKLAKMLEQVEKKSKSGKSGKPTKAQEEQLQIMEIMVEVMETLEEPVQIKDLQKMEGLEEFSNQKLSALMKKLVDTGRVEKIADKKVSKFQVIKVDIEQE